MCTSVYNPGVGEAHCGIYPGVGEAHCGIYQGGVCAPVYTLRWYMCTGVYPEVGTPPVHPEVGIPSVHPGGYSTPPAMLPGYHGGYSTPPAMLPGYTMVGIHLSYHGAPFPPWVYHRLLPLHWVSALHRSWCPSNTLGSRMRGEPG